MNENEVVQSEPVVTEKKKMNKKIVIGISALLVLVIGGLLLYRFYFGSTKRLFVKAIDHFVSSVKEMNQENKPILPDTDTYRVDSKLNLNVESAFLDTLKDTSADAEVYINVLKNLKNLSTNISYQQDTKKEKTLVDISSMLNQTELFSMKYLIQNNKGYYKIKDLTDQYVKGEKLDFNLFNATMTEEDQEYLLDFVVSSFKKNLKKEYFERSNEKIKLNQKDTDVEKIVLKIDKKIAQEFLKNMINDLQKDKKAKNILSKNNIKLDQLEIDKEIPEDFGKFHIIVYIDKFTYHLLSYGIEMKNDTSSMGTYYEEVDKNKENITFYMDDKLMYTLNVTRENKEVKVTILDASNKKIGNITAKKKEESVQATIDINYEATQLLIDMTTTRKENNISCDINMTVSSSGIELFKITANVDNKFSDQATIEENVDNAVEANTVDEEKIQYYFLELLMKLASAYNNF